MAWVTVLTISAVTSEEEAQQWQDAQHQFVGTIPQPRERPALHAVPGFGGYRSSYGYGSGYNSSYSSGGSSKWGDAPPSISKGAKLAVLMGDPSKEGPFVMRLKTPANYKIAPHTHTQAEQITVLSGTLILGMGEKIDKAHESALPAGGFHMLPGKTPHYAMSKVPTMIQVSGNGPFDINYLNPADNPDKSAKQ
jgi:hypothetical protein